MGMEKCGRYADVTTWMWMEVDVSKMQSPACDLDLVVSISGDV